MLNSRYLDKFKLIILSILFSFLIVQDVRATDYNIKYCLTYEDARTCSSRCAVSENTSISFKIYQNSHSVAWRTARGSKSDQIGEFTRCNIFDDNNWNCSQSSDFKDPHSTVIQQMMIDGRFMQLVNVAGNWSYSCGLLQ